MSVLIIYNHSLYLNETIQSTWFFLCVQFVMYKNEEKSNFHFLMFENSSLLPIKIPIVLTLPSREYVLLEAIIYSSSKIVL